MSSLYWKSPSIVLFSSSSIFMVVFFFFFFSILDFLFVPLWLHSSKTDHSLPQVYWIKSITTQENGSHFCFHNTSQPYCYCLGAHLCGSRKKQERGDGTPPPPWVESGVNLVPRSYTFGAFSVRKVIRLPFWLWYLHHDGKKDNWTKGHTPTPRADTQHKYWTRNSHLPFGTRYQEKGDRIPAGSLLQALHFDWSLTTTPSPPLTWVSSVEDGLRGVSGSESGWMGVVITPFQVSLTVAGPLQRDTGWSWGFPECSGGTIGRTGEMEIGW